MARWAFKGVEEYALKLSKLGAASEQVAGKAIYAAAEIVADAMRQNIRALPVQNGKAAKGETLRGISEPAKRGLEESFGIASIQKDEKGFYNVKLGFDEYNAVKTRKFPKGQPNAMIARSVEGGTSFMPKHPFVAPAIRKTRAAAEKKMEEIIDQETKKIMG